MKSRRTSLLVALALFAAAPAGTLAQDTLPPDHPPMGPADIMNQTGQATDQPPDVQMPPGHPPTGTADPQDPHAGVGGPGNGPTMQLATAEPSGDVPPGSIRVTVVDKDLRPVPNADLNIGVMLQEGRRDRTAGRTDAQGQHVFTGLATGGTQAYRINVPHQGATYSSTPFQLPADRGYAVRIVRLPTTRDDRAMLLAMGQVFIELRDDRLRITQQLRLVNLGETTYVFPTAGKLLRLPTGFVAFQTEPVMTDQRLTEASETGVRIHGSMPPGGVDLAYAFDVPLHGATEAHFTVPVPFKSYIFQVISQAPEGLRLEIDGMPKPHTFEDQGSRLLGSALQRSPGDPAFTQAAISVTGIPGPGPARWIASVLAAIAALIGLGFGVTGGARAQNAAAARATRRQELLDEAVELEELRSTGEVGPKFKARRLDAIVAELSMIIREDAASKAAAASPAKRPRV